MHRSSRLADLREYYFSLKMKEIQALGSEGFDVINLGIGSPDLVPDVSVIRELAHSAKDPGHHGYQPYNGTRELRKAIAAWMQREFQAEVDPSSEILPLMGSKEGILHISLATLDPGDIVAIPELGYPAYRSISTMIGAKIVEYPMTGNWQPDWQSMGPEVRRAKLLWMNYPNMPTGAGPSGSLFAEAVDWARSTGTLICHDNPYSHVLNPSPGSILSIPGSKECALELHSLSKSHNMAGWRIGWLCGSKALVRDVLTIKSNIDSGMFRGLQDAAIKALGLPSEWHQERNGIYRARQKIAFRILESSKCEFSRDQKGLFVWGKLPGNIIASEWSELLLREKHVFISPGQIFGERGMNYIRISLCETEARIAEALYRLNQ